MFDPSQFLDMQVEGSNDTKLIPVPAGEFTAISEKVECRTWTSKKDPSKSGVTLEVHWLIDDNSVKEMLGRDKVSVRQGIMLDLLDSGGLDMGKGKNVGLGRLREALNMNSPGEPFSFSMIPGRMAKIKVDHRIDGDAIYAEVKGVTKV
jgi:hypothetical protein